MKITEKELRQLIKEAIQKKLSEAVTDKNKEPSEDWVKFVANVDDFVRDTIKNAKELVAEAEKIKTKELEKDGTGIVKDRRVKEYQTVDHRMHFVKNLITKLSSVDFDMSESYYKGKI